MYKLDKVGQAIEKNDFTAANSILGQDSNAKWIKNINVAFTKVLIIINYSRITLIP